MATVSLTPEQRTEYAGRYADPGQTVTVSATDNGLELTVEMTPEPGTWQAAIAPPAPGPMPVTFLAQDMAVVGGGLRLPFVRDGSGRVGWVAEGLRLRPRVPAAVPGPSPGQRQ